MQTAKLIRDPLVKVAKILATSSPMERVMIANKNVFIKRTDKISYKGLSGNKVYKLLYLAEMVSFPSHVAAMGGYQGHLMLSLSRLVQYNNKDKKCHSSSSITKNIPAHVKLNPVGNYANALESGMEIIEVASPEFNELLKLNNTGCIKSSLIFKRLFPTDVAPYWIHHGGACAASLDGIELLAVDLIDFILGHRDDRAWKIVNSSGTGATAMLLASEINRLSASWSHCVKDIDVLAVSCVMSPKDLTNYMQSMMNSEIFNNEPDNQMNYILPRVLENSSIGKRLPFGAVNVELLQTWHLLQEQTSIEFDMLYAPSAWLQIFSHWESHPSFWRDCNIIYIHCGGQESNTSQLLRYAK